jgi:hypothetical protein
MGCYNDAPNQSSNPTYQSWWGGKTIEQCAALAKDFNSIFQMQQSSTPQTNTANCYLINNGDMRYAQYGPAQCSANTDFLNNPINQNNYIVYKNTALNMNSGSGMGSTPSINTVDGINNLVKNYSETLGENPNTFNMQYNTTADEIDNQIQNELNQRIQLLDSTSIGNLKQTILNNLDKQGKSLNTGVQQYQQSNQNTDTNNTITESFEGNSVFNVLPNINDIGLTNDVTESDVNFMNAKVRIAFESNSQKNRMIRFLIGFILVFTLSLIPIYGIITGYLELKTVLLFIGLVFVVGSIYYFIISPIILNESKLLEDIKNILGDLNFDLNKAFGCPAN